MLPFTRKGLKFRKLNANEARITVLPPMGELWVPLARGSAEKVSVICTEGQRIKKYDKLSDSKNGAVFSPCSGLINGICNADCGALKNVRCAKILVDAEQPEDKIYSSVVSPDMAKIKQICAKFGITDELSGKSPVSLIETAEKGAKLIVSAADNGPDMAAYSAIMFKYFNEICSAAGWIAAAIGGDFEIICDNPFVRAKLKSADSEAKISVVSSKYPAGFHIKKYAVQQHSVLIGALAVLELFFAISFSRPLTSAFVSVLEEGKRIPEIYEIPGGTRVGQIIKTYSASDRRITVMGGIMNGSICLENDVIPPGITALTNIKKPSFRFESCLGCGECMKVCPVGASPCFIYDALRTGESTSRFGSGDCIGCGACSYVCPSGIPLAEIVLRSAEREETQ